MNGTCFGTLALGEEFTEHARRLAADFTRFAPSTKLVVLTDHPDRLRDEPNAIAIPHRQVSAIRPYHDKRLVHARALERFECCVLVDADARLFAPIPDAWLAGIERGVSARFSTPFPIKQQQELEGAHAERRLSLNHLRRRWDLLRRVAARLGVKLDDATFVTEYLFAVRRLASREHALLAAWEDIARFLELRGLSWGEGYAIGLAALSARVPILPLAPAEDWLFKDAITRRRQHKSEPVHPEEQRLLEDRTALGRRFARRGLARSVAAVRNSVMIGVRYGRLLAGSRGGWTRRPSENSRRAADVNDERAGP